MKKLRKHHYIPVFYLNQWADKNSRLLKFTRPRGGAVHADPTSPKGTGYERGLYRVPGVAEHLAELIEDSLMKKMDDLASEVLKDFISNRLHGWTPDRKEAWSRFIVGLLLRNPENLARIKDELKRYADMNYDKWREEYERTKPPNAAPFDTIDALNSLRVTLISFDTFVNNRILLDALNNLKWGMVDVTGSKYRFVTSDRPVVRTNGLDKPGSHVIVPLSPTRLFIAADNDATARIFQQMPPRDLVMRINRKVVRNAIRFVWAGDMTNERLIMEQHAADAATDPTYF